MKNVGLYIPNLSGGGAERVVTRVSTILKEQYNVFIILDEEVIEYNVDCKIINLNIPPQSNILKKLSLPIRRAYRLYRIKKYYELSSLISFLTNANIVNALSDTRTTSTILSVRNFTEIESKRTKLSRIKNFIIKYLYKRADVVVPVSLALEKSLSDLYKIPEKKLKTIYNPYDVKEITDLSEQIIDNHIHNEFFSSGKIFITVGRLSYQKGYWHLLKAFALVSKDMDTKLCIIGKGRELSKMQELIKALKIEDKVLLLGHQENPFKYIAKSHCYILSSLYEGFPNAMVEAMACGCPVIATDCQSGPREILFDNVDFNNPIDTVQYADYGIVVPKMSLKEDWENKNFEECEKNLAKAMKIIIENKSIRSKYIKLGKERAKEFNYQACLKNYTEVIEHGK